MDVIRDRSIVQLNQNQVRVLETNLQATRDRQSARLETCECRDGRTLCPGVRAAAAALDNT